MKLRCRIGWHKWRLAKYIGIGGGRFVCTLCGKSEVDYG